MSREAAPRAPRWRAVLVALAAAGALGLAAGEEFFETLAERLSRASVTSDLRTRNRLRTVLRRGGALEVQPPGDLDLRAATDEEGRCPDPELAPRRVAAAEMPSSRLAPPELLLAGRSALSLYLEPCRARRLERHRAERGRDWEEVGWISVFRDGRLRFATAVGVRIHGRTRRLWRVPSYRLYFRTALGAREYPAELLHPESPVSPRRLVVKWDPGADLDRRPWPFVNAVAYDIARRLGARAPYARPVALNLNGGAPLPYTIEEHIDDEYLEAHFGHSDFDFVRAKRDAGDAGGGFAKQESGWISSRPEPLRRADVAARHDLDQLVAGLLTVAFCGTGDTFQDVMIRDRRGVLAGGRWSWVLWDLEQSFHDYPHAIRFPRTGDLLPELLRGGQIGHRFLPGRILHRLLTEDPAFRAEVGERLLTALDERLTPEFFAALLARYRALADETAVEDREFLARWERYFAERPAVLRAQVAGWLAAGRGAAGSR